MKIENGKIVEATENELFSLYLDRGMDDIMDFHEYRYRMEVAGCAVKGNSIIQLIFGNMTLTQNMIHMIAQLLIVLLLILEKAHCKY